MISKQLSKYSKLAQKIQLGNPNYTLFLNQCSRYCFLNSYKVSQAYRMAICKKNFLCHNNKYCFTQNQNNQSTELIDDLNNKFDQQYNERKYEECLETLRKLVEIKQENGLDIGYEVQQIGHVLIKNKRVQDGLDVLYDLKSQLESLNINDPLLLSKISENISKGEMINSNLEKALNILNETIPKIEKVVSYENPSLYDMLARNYSQRGNIYSLDKDKKQDFIAQYSKAKDIYEKFEELIPEQKKSFAIILQKIANACIGKNELDLAETNIAKSKQLWMELEKNEPIDPNHFSTLITFGVVELYKGRVHQGMKVINQSKTELAKKIKQDQSYSNSYMATITIVAGILKSNPAAKKLLEQVKVEYDEGLKILEGSDEDGPTKILLEEYKQIKSQLFN
ncbi:hypothetical protein ABPG72_003915 [Tetrahymena utriculariae]